MPFLPEFRIDLAESRRRPFSVLFLCTANVCRSPAAQAIFQRVVNRHGLSRRFHISSAGTSTWKQGVMPDFRMRWEAFRRGYLLNNRSRQLGFRDLKITDMVVAMSHQQIRDAQRINRLSKAEMWLLTEFLDDSWPDEVPDPINRSPSNYRLVLDMIENSCIGILDHCKQRIDEEETAPRSHFIQSRRLAYAT